MRPTDPRLREHLAPARRSLTVVVGAGVLGSLLVIAQAFAITGLVVAAIDGRHLRTMVVLVMAVLSARALVGWYGDRSAARAAALVSDHLRRRLVESLLARPGTRSSGELSVLATRGVAAAEPYLTRYLPAVVLAGVLPALAVAAIATQDLLSAGIVLVTLPLVPLFGALVGLATRDRAASQWRAMSSLSGHFLDVMRGLPTLVGFGRAEAQSATIGRITHRYRRATLRTLRVAFASSAVLELVSTLSVALVAVTVGLRLAAGGLDLRTALVVLLLAPESYWPLRRAGAEFHAAAEGTATFEEMSALGPPPRDEPAVRTPWTGALQVSGLRMVHLGRSVAALRDLDLVIPELGVTVVVGPSGSGKSTLLAGLAGLLEPAAGSITVDGHPATGTQWRSHVALLPQRPVFLADTIAANLRLARTGAGDDELWRVLREVALEERVRSLPAGLDAPLGEDGATLSAGERARLALARVVLADRPWVLLDEPTAHLDAVTERVIADTIVSLGRDRGVVVVAHSDALVELADHAVRLLAPDPVVATTLVRSTAPQPRRARPTTRPRTDGSDDPSVDPPPTSYRRRLVLATCLGAFATSSGMALTATAGWLIVRASEHPPVLTLLVAIVAVRTFGLGRPVLRYAERLLSHDAALGMLAERRVRVYDAVVPLTPGRLGRRRGDVLASVVDDVDAVVDRELRVLMPGWTAVVVRLGAAAVAAQLLPVAGVIVALTCLLGGTAAFAISAVAARRSEATAVRTRAELSAKVVETTQVVPELVMWQAGPAAVEAVLELSRVLGRAGERAAAGVAGARAAVLLVTGAGIGAMALVTAPRLTAGSVSAPVLALLVLLPLALAEVLLPLADAGSMTARVRAAQGRLRALETSPPAVLEPDVAVPAPSSCAVGVIDVDAGWGPTAALQGLSLDVGPGERVGVVGPSGSGKSTLAALLLRFVDPVAGRITLGGVGMPTLALADVRRLVGLVDDDPHVFASTLAENVRLARPGADDHDLETVLRRACLGPWLDSLPDGLGTWLGDGHGGLSGGERARLALARSLLADQPVLVLDEPTAHLDRATADDLVREVLDATEGGSIVWITHARAGLDRMDRIVDLGQVGRTVPVGVSRRA